MEYKALPAFTKSIEGKTVTGIFCVHGHMDSMQDISHPGSFTKTIADRGKRVKMLWNHDFWGGPPTAVVKSLREVTRDDLPEAVLAIAPDATGGVEIVREYLDTPRGDEVFAGIKAGAISEMSYGYDAIKYDFNTIDNVEVRNLREIRLWEVSDVLWGANDATQASKHIMPVELLLKQLDAYLKELKAGARHSSADLVAINQIHKMIVDLGATNCKGLIDGESESDTPEQDDEAKRKSVEDAARKSRAATELALTQMSARLRLLDLSLT